MVSSRRSVPVFSRLCRCPAGDPCRCSAGDPCGVQQAVRAGVQQQTIRAGVQQQAVRAGRQPAGGGRWLTQAGGPALPPPPVSLPRREAAGNMWCAAARAPALRRSLILPESTAAASKEHIATTESHGRVSSARIYNMVSGTWT